MIILRTSHLLFFYFKTPSLCFSNLDEIDVCFKLFGCRLFLMIFVEFNAFSSIIF